MHNTRQGLTLTAVNAAAEAAGLTPGMVLPDARAMLPGLATAAAEPEADRAALARLAHWCGRYSPWTAVDTHAGAGPLGEPDGLWIDATGCAHLFGGEAALLADIGQRFAGLGFMVRTALSSTPGSAWALARYGRSSRPVVGEGESLAAAVAALPVAGLRLSAGVQTDLLRFGLATIDAVAALPRAALARRFDSRSQAAIVVRRLDELFGRRDEALSPLVPVPAVRSRRAFTEPLLDISSLVRNLPAMAAELIPPLEASHQGIRQLTLEAFRTDGSVGAVTVGTAAPSRDPDHLIRLLEEKLAFLDPGFGIDAMALTMVRSEPMDTVQGALLNDTRPSGSTEMPLAPLIDRLTNRFGSERVTVTRPQASYIPERAVCRIPAITARRVPPAPEGENPVPLSRPFRLFDRPESIEVMAEVPDGPPLSFRWRRQLHRVLKAEGPERIAPEWWRDARPGRGSVRDYYCVEDESGRRFWLYRDGLYSDAGGAPPLWYVHGLFA